VDTGSRSGTYQLQVIDTDLGASIQEELVVIDAFPRDGVPLQIAAGPATAAVAGTNLILPGVTEARQNGAILNGATLDIEDEVALYIYIAEDGDVYSRN